MESIQKYETQPKTDTHEAAGLANAIVYSDTNVDTPLGDTGLEGEVDGCVCFPCGCFKSPWTIVLSPAGVAAGLAAAASTAPL